MPLLDHFHPPLSSRLHWQSLFSCWSTLLADKLTELSGPEFVVGEFTRRLSPDVASFEPFQGPPPRTMPAVFPDSFEVRAFSTSGGPTLVAVVKFVGPGNKNGVVGRQAFAAKCASYLQQGIALIVIDVVTSRRANLHNETMRLMSAADEFLLPADADLYAVAYRPVLRQERAEIDIWTAPVAVGQPLPTLPLRLTGDLFVPVEFEAGYMEARRLWRLA